MLWWIAFFNYADRQAVFSVFPLLQQELHLSAVQLGMLGSSFALVYGLFAPLAGAIVDRVRRVSAVLWGLQVWSIVCGATALSRSFGQLLLFRGAEGLGESFYFPASMSLIGDYHSPATRSRAMGLHQTSVYIGTIAGGYFAGRIGMQYGWRWSFVIFGAFGIVLGIALRRFLIEPQRAHAAATSADNLAAIRAIFSSPPAVCQMAAFCCANFVAMVLLSWMPKFLFEKFHLNLAAAGLTATLFVQLASMAASPLGGWLADRFSLRSRRGRLLVQSIGVFCGAPCVALCGLTSSITVLIAALTAWGFFKGLYDANIFASLYDVIPEEARGSAAGWMNTVGWLGGGATAPIIIGIIAENRGLGPAIALASVIYLCAGAALVAAILLTGRKKGAIYA